MQNKAVRGALCYRRPFSDDIKTRFDAVAQRLFTHGLWVNPVNRPTLQSSFPGPISNLLDEQGLDYVYLTRLD